MDKQRDTNKDGQTDIWRDRHEQMERPAGRKEQTDGQKGKTSGMGRETDRQTSRRTITLTDRRMNGLKDM